ncbi:2-C-methyl-D-erythritol 4-phosphate cytidylyltransferase [Herbiconiux sp. CPCC 205763]|uniref:Bifunctional enzyme IspD/IspF n=1 Tax=Herbiconiux aconitum TaxID=2970913 RepID=A0ABT2GRY9_9MICO|nr:2-C-methyl-D-erythritol 4-phosphate cytidylyltransferase [Herbiconiux aconitum]MCS5718337.1 2-C-methyl-D-erythritol 4-phosphate cytidylyltransferase [Herbiconiux aconitum]
MPTERPSVGIIVVAAGSGTRLGRNVPKAFVEVGGRSILSRSIDSIRRISEPVELVVVVPADLVGATSTHLSDTPHVVVAGGATRQQSVAAGLEVLSDAVDLVLVHDAARAFTPVDVFERVIAAVRSGAGAIGVIPGLPVTDTIKGRDADGVVQQTIDRSRLTAVQTPQGFPRALLAEAYARAGEDVTDDAELVQQLGHPVHVVPGDERSFKITNPHDLERAEELAAPGARASAPHWRTGIGVDAHAYASDDAPAELWVAGLHWPGERGLAGHSDGDVVAHAICDALLGASGLGDLGSRFGTSDPALAGAHGEVFLRRTRDLLEQAGFTIGNVSVQLIGNRPRFSPRKAEADALLTSILGAPVSVSATTTDGLGFAGRAEGLTAIATCLVVG